METVEQILSTLTSDEKQILKDAINFGKWGDSDMEFLDENGEIETVSMFGYCTNDAKRAGHFKGRIISSLFKSIYMKLCSANYNQTGRYISHCNDWWGDGNGDMLFIRHEYVRQFEIWAEEKI